MCTIGFSSEWFEVRVSNFCINEFPASVLCSDCPALFSSNPAGAVYELPAEAPLREVNFEFGY